MTYHELTLLGWVVTISGTVLGSGIGFFMGLRINDKRKELARIQRKKKLSHHLETDMMTIKNALEEPKKYFKKDFKPLSYNPKTEMIDGTHISIDFVGYKQLIQSGYLNLFAYGTTDKISIVELKFNLIKQLEGQRVAFNYASSYDQSRREGIALGLIESVNNNLKDTIDAINDALVQLKTEF